MLNEGLRKVTMAVSGYGLLGPVEVRVDGVAVELAGAKQRLLLAMLLLAGGQQVPAGRLVDELWGEALPQDPAGALRTQISRLRRVLGPAGDSLVTVEGGYRLHVQRDQLDATRFQDELAAAAHGYLGGLLAADTHRVHDVGDGAAPGDEPGTLVDQPVVHLADLVVSRICGTGQLTGETGPYLVGNCDHVAHVISPPAVGQLPDHRDPPACRRRVTGVSAPCREPGPGVV